MMRKHGIAEFQRIKRVDVRAENFTVQLLMVYCKMKKKIDQERISKGNPYGNNMKREKACTIGYKVKLILHGYVRYSCIRLGKIPCHKYRDLLLRKVYQMEIAPKAVIYGGFEIWYPWNIKIGEGSIVGEDCKLDGRNGIIIGENVNISTGVWIWTEQHDVQDPFFADNDEGGGVFICDRAWLSSRTTVLPKIKIGKGAVLAAGAVATKDIEPFVIAGGVPADPIGKRNIDLIYEFDGEFIPFY